MFKKFDTKEDVVGTQQLKGSVQKSIVEPFLDQILPKKENFRLVKCRDHLELIADAAGTVQFFKRSASYIPTLRLLHKYPLLLLHQQVDSGAIRFVLNGSHIMCPGLTSPGARLLDECAQNTLVAILAEGKHHAMAIGQKMSSAEIRTQNMAMDTIHFLNDGLWRLVSIFSELGESFIKWKQQRDRWEHEYIVDWENHFEQYKRHQMYRQRDDQLSDQQCEEGNRRRITSEEGGSNNTVDRRN